jgi:hypothetical protein
MIVQFRFDAAKVNKRPTTTKDFNKKVSIISKSKYVIEHILLHFSQILEQNEI